MQPFSTHTSPGPHEPMFDSGTHAPSTHTRSGEAQSLVMTHGVAGTVQMPRATSHWNEGAQSSSSAQPSMHLPSTHFWPAPAHCV